MPPLVSVIVPLYNAGGLIESTLESILSQDYPNLEIILVNDASADDSADIAARVLGKGSRPYRIIEHEKNRGVSAARNTGMFAAEGEYITFVDADDLIDRGYIADMSATVLENFSDVAVGGYRTLNGATGKETRFPLNAPARASAVDFALRVMRGSARICYAAAMYRRAFIEKTGVTHTEGCACGEDAEFFLKAAASCGGMAFSGDCMYVYRIHDAMGSRTGHGTPEQNIKRYTDLIQGRVRAARYIIDRSKSPALARSARYEMLPRYCLKMFTMHAWSGNREVFMKDLRSPDIRDVLFSSARAVFREPGVFLKSLWLLAFPDIYYAYRVKHVYYYGI